MPKCGNCKEIHDTNREVERCYENAGKITARDERPMTAKQANFIDVLLDTLEEREMSEETAEAIESIVVNFRTEHPEPTIKEASSYIDILKGMRDLFAPYQKETEKTEEQETIQFTEAEKLAASSESAPDSPEGLCPRCGAAGNEPCTTKSGNEASTFHKGRYTTAS